MKNLALGLLVLAVALYSLATALQAQHPVWGYVAAAAEAAMVGALADWFAVVALFRHPLGLPVPHTAIIPTQKDRLGAELARFLGTHFLATAPVQQRLARWDSAHTLGYWLAQHDVAQRLGQWLQHATPPLLKLLGQTPARQWVAQGVRQLLRQLQPASLGAQVLGALTAHGHHQHWLNGMLQQLADWAAQETVQERLTEAIARELKELKYLGLDQVAARLATRKLVAALTRTLAEVAADPRHELRQRFDGWMKTTTERLQTDPQWQAQLARWRDTWLDQPQSQATLEAWWHDLMTALQTPAQPAADPDNSTNPSNDLSESMAAVVQAVGQHLLTDAPLRSWLNAQIQPLLLHLLDLGRDSIVDYVAQRVQAWDAQDMSRTLEHTMGRDLQFIRINGTLVGALVGLLLHALTQVLGV